MRHLMRKLAQETLNRLSNGPAAALVSFFALGVVFSQACSEYSFIGLVSGNLLLISASFLALKRARLILSLYLGFAAILISGLLLALAQRDSLSDSDLRALLSKHVFPLKEPVSFQGCVIKDGEVHDRDVITTIELRAFLKKDQWIVCKGKGILRIAKPDPEYAAGPMPELRRGDTINGWATWRIPRNYENPGSADRAGLLFRRGIFLVGRVKSTRLMEIIPDECGNIWTRLATRIAGRVRKSLNPIREKNEGQAAAVLASLTIGDYSGLNNTTREIFQNTGTFHVLVVSGLHVAWIAGVVLQFFKWIRLPERIRYLLAALVILLYTCVVGFQASITRCLWMFLLYLMGRMIFRRADPVNILLTSALILLSLQPNWLFEIGFQLSFLSILAILLTAVPVIRNHWKPLWDPLRHCGKSDRLFLQPGTPHRRGRKLRVMCEMFIEQITDPLASSGGARFLFFVFRCIAGAALAAGGMIFTTLSVQLWIEPLLAYNFNRISWIAPLATLAIVPFSSVVLSAGIIQSLASLLPFCGPVAIRLSGMLSSLLLSGAAFFMAIPGAWQRCPTPAPVIVWGCIVSLFLWSFLEWRKCWISWTPVIALLACLAHGSMPVLDALIRENGLAALHQKEEHWGKKLPTLNFTFLDVGEGDSIVITFPDKTLWVLDAGGLRIASMQNETNRGLDIGEAVVSRYLWHQWIKGIDRLILSHTDMDHAGGMPALIKNFEIGRFDYSGACNDAVLDKILCLAGKKQIGTKPLHAGMKEVVDEVTVRTLNPPKNSRLDSTNENSVVFEFTYKRFAALLTADLEKEGEKEITSQPGNLRIQLLKVAHHGSRTSTTEAFLNRTQPRWAVISAGESNPYGHPSDDVLARLLRYRARPISTIDEGAITLETDGSRYLIKSHLSGILEQGNL
jgi:competence protein ComEC